MGHGMVWVAEDEVKIARLLADYLKASEFETRLFENGAEVVEAARQAWPDLLLLDIGLPGKDGMQVCRELRTFAGFPIIMVTARVEEVDRLLGLELGADDYICKPFSPKEVVARVKAVLRRFRPVPVQEQRPSIFGHEPEGRRIDVAGQSLNLTPNEYNLMVTFLENQGRVFSRDQLLHKLYDDFREVSDRTIDSHVKNLRKKIAAFLPDKEIIHSVYGVGYKAEWEE